MRLDKFLNAVNLTKRRSVALDMCKAGAVLVNGVAAKPAKELRVGDTLTLVLLRGAESYRVLALPEVKNIRKDQMNDFVQKI